MPLIPPRYFIAPTEPKELRSIGTTTLYPETLGCDVICSTFQPSKLFGFQRKEVSDFVASLKDGRLSKELGQIKSTNRLTNAILVLEGQWFWTTEGVLSTSYGRSYSRRGHRSLLAHIQSMGVLVVETDNISDTITTIQSLSTYLAKSRHAALEQRPKSNMQNSWGRITNESFASHLLQSFPGIGPETAKSIYTKFGKAPLSWTVNAEDLALVTGIGIKTAKRLIESLNDGQ